MPIRFKCSGCDAVLSIGSRKAGSVIACPKCAADVFVPAGQPVEKDWRTDPPPVQVCQQSQDQEASSLDNIDAETNQDTDHRDDHSPRPVRSKSSSANEIVGLFFLLFIAVWVGLRASGLHEAAGVVGGLFLFGFIAIIVGAFLFGAITGLMGWTDCRVCGKRGQPIIRRELIFEELTHGLVVRTAKTQNRGWVGGDTLWSWGSTEWEERVPIIRRTYRRTFQCKRCGNETHERFVEEEEDFNRQ